MTDLDPAATARADRLRRRRRLRRGALLWLGALASVGTFAAWTGIPGASVEDGAFTLTRDGIDIRLSADGLGAAIASMLPGDRIEARLTAENHGVAAFHYAVSTATTDTDGRGLAAALRVTIRTAGTGCAAADGSVLYAGSLAQAAVGDPATGAQPSDRVLAPGESEALCVAVELPLATGNALQGAATSATITATAEQEAGQ